MDPIRNQPHRERDNVRCPVGRIRRHRLAIMVTGQEPQSETMAPTRHAGLRLIIDEFSEPFSKS